MRHPLVYIQLRRSSLFESKHNLVMVFYYYTDAMFRPWQWAIFRLQGIYLRILLLTYLLTAWCSVLLEKQTVFADSQDIPHISRNPKVHYRTHKRPPLSLSWASPIQSIYPHPTSWRSILILSTHLRLGLPIQFPHLDPIHPVSSPIRATCPAHLIWGYYTFYKSHCTVSSNICPVTSRWPIVKAETCCQHNKNIVI